MSANTQDGQRTQDRAMQGDFAADPAKTSLRVPREKHPEVFDALAFCGERTAPSMARRARAYSDGRGTFTCIVESHAVTDRNDGLNPHEYVEGCILVADLSKVPPNTPRTYIVRV